MERISAASAMMRTLRRREGAKPKGKGLDLPVNLHSYPHIWSRVLGSEQKNEIGNEHSS